jgi:hypothetical protein
MSNDEYIADLGDTAVFHSKVTSWDGISSTTAEPLSEILHDTGSSINKQLNDNPNASLGNIMHVGYEAYLTLWNGTDGDYHYAAYLSFIRFNGLTIGAGKVLCTQRVEVCMQTASTVQDYPYSGTTYYGPHPYTQGGTVKSALLMTRYAIGEGPTGVFTPTDWFDPTGITVQNASSYQKDASDFAGGSYTSVWHCMARDGMAADVLSQANTANGLNYGFLTDWLQFSQIGTARVGPWYYIGLQQASGSINGPTQGPRLVLGVVDNHPLFKVLGASVQLADGSHVYLTWSGTNIILNRKTTPAGSATTIATIATDVVSGAHFMYRNDINSQQCFDVCRDAADNIYFIGPNNSGSGANHEWQITCFKKTSSTTWSASGTTTYLDTTGGENYFYGAVNNVCIDWMPETTITAHNAGFIVWHINHRYGDAGTSSSQRAQNSWGTVDCHFLINDTTPPASIFSYNAWDPSGLSNKNWPRNGAGTGMDLMQLSGGVTVVSGFDTQPDPGLRDRTWANQWAFTNDHNGNVGDLAQLGSSAKQQNVVTHDSASKLRILHMGSTDWFATFQGGKIEVRKYSTFNTIQASIDLTTQGITSFPSKATINTTCNWDVFFDKVSQTFWVYFVDSANPRRVLRVGWKYATNTLMNAVTPVQMATNLGPSGSKVISLRIPRKKIDERWVHMDVGIQAADTTLSLTNIEETAFNIAPTKPVVNNIASFNATTTAGPVSWTFNDSNPADTQSKYDIQIRRISDSVVVYNPATITGPVVANGATSNVTIPVSTLTNNTNYQVRVRTYDFYGAISDWSDWKNFATVSNGLTTTITSPATDNAPLTASSLAISWTFTSTGGTHQVSYRIKVYRTSDNSVLQDSGVVTSTATTATVSSLVSDVEQRIEVVVTDNAANSSAPGIRLVTPSFNNPQAPVITVMAGDGYLEVQITNPVPGTDQPQVIRNDIYRRENGTTAWTKIGTTTPNGVYKDYAVAAFLGYDYMVEGVA